MKQNTVKIASQKELQAEIKKAMQLYKTFHWGVEPDKQYRAKQILLDKSDTLMDIGYLAALVYITMKGDSKHPEYFFHTFKQPLPTLSTLAMDGNNGKGLFVTGGKFRIEADGIID